MLFVVGPLVISRRPFNIEEWDREVNSSWAKQDLLDRAPDRQFTGGGDEPLNLSGTLAPFNRNAIAGLSGLALAESLCRTGQPVFVTRGDGRVFGFYGIESVKQSHTAIGPQTGGIGQAIKHELKLVPVGQPGASVGADMLSTLISLLG